MQIEESKKGTTIILTFSEPLTGIYDLEVFACVPEGWLLAIFSANYCVDSQINIQSAGRVEAHHSCNISQSRTTFI